MFKTIRHIADAIERFVHRAVAASGNDEFKTVGDGFRREPSRVTGGCCGFQRALRGDFVEMAAKMSGFVAASGWIENDAGAHATVDLWRARR
jgi:hypothetical protein